MSEDKFIPQRPVWEDDQCISIKDLEMMIKYNKACERLTLISYQPAIAAQLHSAHIFAEALLTHLKNGKQPSFYDAWEVLVKEVPERLRSKVFDENND